MPELAPHQLTIGPLEVTSPCPVQGRTEQSVVQIRGGCPMQFKNMSRRTQWVTSHAPIATDGAGSVQESSTHQLYPGQIMTLPAPPPGHTWHCVVVSRQAIKQTLDGVGEVAVGVLALAGYGAVTLFQKRHTIWQRIRRGF